MKHLLLLVFLFTTVTTSALAGPIEVRLDLSPTSTLPALPVGIRVSVKNVSGSPVVVYSPTSATVTDGNGISTTAFISLPTAWTPELGVRSSYSIAPGVTLECIGLIDPFFAENGLFSSELPLSKPGTYSVRLTVYTSDGGTAISTPAAITVMTPGGDDYTIWQELSEGGIAPFSSPILIESFALLAEYPSSQYYRHVAPFTLNADDRDDDRYAANLTLAVQGLPGVFVDGARLAIALRYQQRAASESAHNRQAAAGQWSAKGRVFTQQLIDSPASPFGTIVGTNMTPTLKTTEDWQAEYDVAHTGRDGWTEPPPPPMSVAVTPDLLSAGRRHGRDLHCGSLQCPGTVRVRVTGSATSQWVLGDGESRP